MGLLGGGPNCLRAPPSLVFAHPSSSSKKSPRRRLAWLKMTSADGESNADAAVASRRGVLLLAGLSVLPFLKLGAVAADDVVVHASDKQDVIEADKQDGIEMNDHNVVSTEMQDPKGTVLEASSEGPSQVEQAQRLSNSGMSFANVVGISGSGILGALFATSQKEKAAAESNMKLMKSNLTAKEAAMSAMEKKFQKIIQAEQEESKKLVRSFKEDEVSLLNQLASANDTTSALQQELQNERNLVEELNTQILQLESKIDTGVSDNKILEAKYREKLDCVIVLQDKINLLRMEIHDEEKNVESLKFSLSKSESEYEKSISNVEQLRNELTAARSTVEQLEEDIARTRSDLSLKVSSIDSLTEKIQSLNLEKDISQQKLNDLMEEYSDLKAASDRRETLDAELLLKKDEQIQHLEEKLELALTEGENNNAVIADLRKEKDHVKALLERERNTLNKLKEELRITEEALGASKLEATNISQELNEAKDSYENLMSEASKIKDEFSEAKKTLTDSLEEAKSNSKSLSEELVYVKDILMKTKEELDVTSKELADVISDSENLKKELVETYKRQEVKDNELKEEIKLVSALNYEIEVLGRRIESDAEAQKSLKAYLDEATKSLDEMNKNALLISSELQSSSSMIASLEAEKEILMKSLLERKEVTVEAQENVEDAQNLIMRLQNERENLENWTKKLEEDLSSAKGEILRLRQISMEKESIDEIRPYTKVAAGTPFSERKSSSRRRKRGSKRATS